MIKVRIDNAQYSISQIQNMLTANPTTQLVLEASTTKAFTIPIIRRLMQLNGASRLSIRVIGGYDDKRVADYPSSTYHNMHTNDNIYTLGEMVDIVTEIENIESGLNPNWDDLQKLIYFIGQLKNRIMYHPFHENQPSKDIRSLRGLFSRKTVCAGYALILKEICDRNGIECQYVEGCCRQADIDKGYLTHAWNIVKINGQYVPVDLTWNAGAHKRGKMLDIDDLFNVNEFVKSHIPGKKELIQNYRGTLKSIDGQRIRELDAIINKDVKYEMTANICRRKDGSRFRITMVGQFVKDNKYLYKYIYQDMGQDGKLSEPVILYSTTNATEIISAINKVEKLKDQYRYAQSKGDTEKMNKLRPQIDSEKTKYLYDSRDMMFDLLFSKTNIETAKKRGDFFLGGVVIKYKKVDVLDAKSVEIEKDLGAKIGLRQRTLRRNDGTTFVLESYGTITVNGRMYYKYRLFESIMENGKPVVSKNTIFTDQDIMQDYRPGIANDFLSRSRLDRKRKESNGYLGYYSREGTRVIDPNSNEFFAKHLFKRYHIDRASFKNYYNEVTFAEMKRLVGTYDEVYEKGTIVYKNRYSGQVVTDPDLLLHIKFSHLWLSAAGTEFKENEPIPGYAQAFNDESERAFKYLSSLIVYSMNASGNIDPVAILIQARDSIRFSYAQEIIVRMFSSQEAANMINTLYRLQNPSTLEKQEDIPFFSKGRMANAEIMLNRRLNLERHKQFLEVLKNAQGSVEIRPFTK